MGGVRVQQVRLPVGVATWTVVGAGGLSIEAAEEYLEYLRVSSSPNTVKSYAQALALWWRWLQTTQVGWRDVGLSEFTGFVHWLRTGEDGTVVAFAPGAPRLSESTVAVRLQAVLSFYRYQALNGVPAAVALTQRIHRSSPHAELKRRITHLEQHQRATLPVPRVDPDARSSVVRTLTVQIAGLKRRHRDEVTQLRQDLAAAHGEILALRRKRGEQRR